MDKKRLVVSYANLSQDLLKALKEKYPYGFSNHVIKVNTSSEIFFHAVTLETEEANYLVKVNVKIDTNIDDDDDKDFDDQESGELGDSDTGSFNDDDDDD